VLPARAGVAPTPDLSTARRTGAPCSRGGGPGAAEDGAGNRPCSPLARGWPPSTVDVGQSGKVLPARAGVAPAVRGRPAAVSACSPLARGWPQGPPAPDGCRRVLPARAGVAPRPPSCRTRRRGAPRSRGGGPRPDRIYADSALCSPLARGWPLTDQRPAFLRRVLPARAGVAPPLPVRPGQGPRAPRSRGGGPGNARLARW